MVSGINNFGNTLNDVLKLFLRSDQGADFSQQDFLKIATSR
jgi:hypothetical protein